MAQRYIYLADELNNKLKLEENASRLICNLLQDYYENQRLSYSKVEEVPSKLVELEQQLIKEREKYSKVIEERQKEEELKELDEEKKKEKEDKFRSNFENNFTEIVKREPTQEEFERFKDDWDNDRFSNLYSWLENRGLYKEDENTMQKS